MIADKAYDSDTIREHIETMGARAVLTPKQDRVAEALRPNGPNLVAEIEPVKPAGRAS